ARQRFEAAQRLGLWLIARECWSRDATRELGDPLAALALEAARRQSDNHWALAMLREWGQCALDRGDRKGAERRWAEMLELVLANLQAPKKDEKKKEDASKPAPAGRVKKVSQIPGTIAPTPATGTTTVTTGVGSPPLNRAPKAQNGAPVVALDRFE